MYEKNVFLFLKMVERVGVLKNTCIKRFKKIGHLLLSYGVTAVTFTTSAGAAIVFIRLPSIVFMWNLRRLFLSMQ